LMHSKWFVSVAGLACAFSLLRPISAIAADGVGSRDSRPANGPVAGYLPAHDVPDAAVLLGPPPADGSGTKIGDEETFRKTRELEGTPRWALAATDAEYGPAALLRVFSCAAGRALSPDRLPTLSHMLARALEDSSAATQHAKKLYQRPRPFLDHEGPVCVLKDQRLVASYSYPSGHSAAGWMAGLILAALLPDHAADLLARARSYGESRVVCGVHYESDVQAGRMTAAAVFAALESNPAFRADLATARRELHRSARDGSARDDGNSCAVQADAAKMPVW